MNVGDRVALKIAPALYEGEVVRIRDSDSHPFIVGVKWDADADTKPAMYYAERELEVVNARANA